MAIKHYLQFSDFTLDEYEYVIERSRVIKRKFKNYEPHHTLADRTLVMVFEKNSTRTRLSFEAGMHQMGGAAIYLNTRDSQLGRGEPVEDAAQVMSRMCDVIMIRTYGQEIIERFKDDAKEVVAGQECGMSFESYQDMRPGDGIECYRVETIQRSL